MHIEPLNLDVKEAIEGGPLEPSPFLVRLLIMFLAIGVFGFFAAYFTEFPKDQLWGIYYQNVIFWMGLAAGGVMTTVIMQIVRARWSPPVRRIAEANVAFLPYAWVLFLCTYFGRHELFPWANAPMPGREIWMRPECVYLRFAILFGGFFFLLHRYVRTSLRGDIGFARDQAPTQEKWKGWTYASITKGWKGAEREILPLQRKLSCWGPVVVLCYAIVYTLFATEMIVGMDTIWFSNMFGGFQFLGNIYIGWSFTALVAIYLAKNYSAYNKVITTRQTWDLGMLMLGFSMLWGYTFFAQFLPQWYSNMPEETQWLILRTREFPWKNIGWLTFTLCFIMPFILLLSEDVKRAPKALCTVAIIAMAGVWFEKYIVIMPQLSPGAVPFGFVDITILLGFIGVYGLAFLSFLKKFPFIPVSHPLTHDSIEW
jgi:Ni/Fe-hydrogenase subunit HybB-like protein